MKRMHIHVSVADLPESIRFYSGLFSKSPSVQKDDYAKWMLDDPRINFAVSRRSAQLGLNHLGIQVESATELDDMQTRLAALKPDLQKQEGAACCYAKSDKYWVQDPSGIAWETFHTLDTLPVFGESGNPDNGAEPCCVPLAKTAESESACCVPSQAASTRDKCC